MSKKSKNLYKELFQVLKDLELTPKSLSIDFELASIKAAKDIWPDIQIAGCHFHFTNAIKKYVNAKCPDLKKIIFNEEYPSRHMIIINKFRALAVTPLDYVQSALEIIYKEIENLPNPEIMTKFIDYFDSFWINKVFVHFRKAKLILIIIIISSLGWDRKF